MPRSIPTTTDLYPLLAQGMGPDLHWFPEEVSISRLAACLVGMANTSGGRVLLGIAPRSAQVTGVEDVEAAIDRVFQASLLSDPPLVLPVPVVASVGSSDAKVVWITVPGGLPNVYSLEGSYLGREGRQTNPLSARRLRQLLIERGTIQFESNVPPGATLEDLDPMKVNLYLDRIYQKQAPSPSVSNSVSREELLLRRGCLQYVEGELRPNYAGIMLFGRCPQQWLPNATALAAHFPGIAFTDNYIKQDVTGTIPEQLQQLETFIRDNIRTVVRLSGLVHKEMLEYPFEAVRELVINAVAHRDYNSQGDNVHLNIFSDRLEVLSPGGLPGPVNLDNLLEARFSRNAVIFQVLSDMGFVERLGYGLDRVVAVMRQNMMRPPHFEETAGCFKVTLYGMEKLPADRGIPDLSSYQGYDLNSRQQMALSYLATHPRITSSTYQELCPDVHPETLRRDLADLAQKSILLKIGDKRATYYILKKSIH